MRTAVFGFLLAALLALTAAGQAPTKAPEPKLDAAAMAKPGPDPLALTREEIKDLRIAALETKQAQMEQALLQARFRELGEQIDQMKESRAALEARIIAAHKAPAGSRIDADAMKIIPPAAPSNPAPGPPPPEPAAKPGEARNAPR